MIRSPLNLPSESAHLIDGRRDGDENHAEAEEHHTPPKIGVNASRRPSSCEA